MNVRLPEPFRAERALTLRVAPGTRINAGWECRRPFVNVSRRDIDPDCGYVSWFNALTFGGCKVWQGRDCVLECDGCLAYAGSFETAYSELAPWEQEAEDEMALDDPRSIFVQAEMLADTVGHHPTRCGQRNPDMLMSVGVDNA